MIITGGAVAGFLNTITDAMVVLLRKTIYRDHTKKGELKEGNGLTYVLGSVINVICGLLNHTLWRGNPREIDYRHKLALDYWSRRETIYMITRSLSYGLLLFSVGLCVTLIYLLVGTLK